jgi:hypothetical protein
MKKPTNTANTVNHDHECSNVATYMLHYLCSFEESKIKTIQTIENYKSYVEAYYISILYHKLRHNHENKILNAKIGFINFVASMKELLVE